MRSSVEREFHRNFSERGDVGASFAVYSREGLEIELCGGYRERERKTRWTSDTVAPLWSATKGLEAACVLSALERAGLTPETKVADIWPEFGTNGKERLSVAQLLGHQAGVPALDAPVPSVLDREKVVAAIERQRPFWEPGSAHGYHVRVFGFLCDELVRRLARMPLAQVWAEGFAWRLQLEIWMGLPAALHARAAEVCPPKALEPDPAEAEFYRAYRDPTSLTHRAFTTPSGFHNFSAMNTPEARGAAIASFGAIGNARSLAKFYAAMANGGELEGIRILNSATMEQIENGFCQRPDRILQIETAFSLGFMRDPLDRGGNKQRMKFGPSPKAFGHPGAGGVNGFADPERGIGVAYVMNQMRSGVLPNEKSEVLINAWYKEDQITRS